MDNFRNSKAKGNNIKYRVPIKTAGVCTVNRIVPAINIHIIAQQALSGGGEGVGILEAAEAGVVVAGFQVVELVLRVKDITPVAQGIVVAVTRTSRL